MAPGRYFVGSESFLCLGEGTGLGGFSSGFWGGNVTTF
nr:MAG TPA: hypothetical protein [Caudoviricetes sp.]